MEKLHLTELFDLEILQRFQDSFSAASGISAGVSDENGVAVTKHNSNCAFCSLYTKASEEGLKRCQLCDKRGAELAMQYGRPEIYTCHAGLMDFAAPIMLDKQFLGCFLGGQVLTEPLSEEKVRTYAQELGISPEEYVQAARDIPIVSRKKIENIAEFLYNTGDMLSHMAYKNHVTLRMSDELEREAHMKSDFLANMSHEIRTPMNAVIGMAEMALREELPLAAREYIKQIMASGNTLLAIINDILDFTKIESGKMNINMAEYDFFSIVKDVTNIIMARIGDKKLELVVDVAPDIPRQMMGDSIRIRQIIMNLANNAVKFTREGCVYLSVDFEKKSEWEIILKVYVQDTGIGIKKENMGKLFQSFQQLDSKRNRNIEGTGLGLAISKQLITLMNGQIWVESEYGKGSRFSFEIPQLVIDAAPSVDVEQKTWTAAGLLCENRYVVKSMKKILHQLQVNCVLVQKAEDLKLLEENKAEFFFIENKCYSGKIQEYLAAHSQITGVLMTGFQEQPDTSLKNILAIRKPLHVMNVAKILAHEDLYGTEDELEESFEFIAPEAEILIVDDNVINLTVAEGLLAPLEMKVDKATSGRQAIEMIEKKHYDMIFMDHMMPELDGIETTHIIRRFHEEYDDVPIVALTANVVEEMQAKFLVEGMNDFVAKPIEVKVIVDKVKQWLPAKKIQKIEGNREEQKQMDEKGLAEKIAIPELDVELALRLAGGEKLFWQILKEYARAIPKKSQLLQQQKEEEDWKNYTIEVHALKSASKQVGAVELSELAAEMERAGKNNEIEFILAHHEQLLEKYRALGTILEKHIETSREEKQPKNEYDAQKVEHCLECMQDAIDNLDLDAMDAAVRQLDRISLLKEEMEYFARMKEAVEEVEVEICETIIKEWKEFLES